MRNIGNMFYCLAIIHLWSIYSPRWREERPILTGTMLQALTSINQSNGTFWCSLVIFVVKQELAWDDSLENNDYPAAIDIFPSDGKIYQSLHRRWYLYVWVLVRSLTSNDNPSMIDIFGCGDGIRCQPSRVTRQTISRPTATTIPARRRDTPAQDEWWQRGSGGGAFGLCVEELFSSGSFLYRQEIAHLSQSLQGLFVRVALDRNGMHHSYWLFPT